VRMGLAAVVWLVRPRSAPIRRRWEQGPEAGRQATHWIRTMSGRVHGSRPEATACHPVETPGGDARFARVWGCACVCLEHASFARGAGRIDPLNLERGASPAD
jgi:hypothetical protein